MTRNSWRLVLATKGREICLISDENPMTRVGRLLNVSLGQKIARMRHVMANVLPVTPDYTPVVIFVGLFSRRGAPMPMAN